MQDLQGLTKINFEARSNVTVGKVEVDIDGSGNFHDLVDLEDINISCNIINEVMLLAAVSFTITCLNTNQQYSWQAGGAAYYNWLRQGRKIRIYAGIKVGGTKYYWKWITGKIDHVEFTKEAGRLICTITGKCFMSMLIENHLKQEYWGSQKAFSTSDQIDEFLMPSNCTGVYRAFLDSVSPYDGSKLKEINRNSDWTYDWTTNTFLLLRGIIPYYSGVNNLVVNYFTAQVVENVIADILIESEILRLHDRSVWLANSDLVTLTGKEIERVWFNKGTPCLTAIRLVSEVVQYRFYLDQDSNPIFKPKPTKSSSVKSLLNREVDIIRTEENVEEVRNHIIIIGEERKKLVKIPTLTTQFPVTSQSAIQVTMWATIDAVGKGNITKRGFQWGIGQQVTETYIETGSFGVGDFSHELLGLTPGTDYFYRAWCENSQGTFFGKWQNYKTTIATAPTVRTLTPTDIVANSIVGNGTISNIGGQNCSRRGFKYGKKQEDEWEVYEDGSFGTGGFDLSITGLDPNVTYYIRAFAKNAEADGFGDYVEFKTLASLPVVSTKDATNWTSSSATLNGRITDDGGGCTERGFEYYKDGEPENVIEVKEIGEFGVATYSLIIDELLAETKYYFRAYAINEIGTAYGSWRSFSTLSE